MRLLGVGPIWPLSTVVGLDGEAVLPLALTVQGLLGPHQTLSRGTVQNHRLKLGRARATGAIVNLKPTDLTWTIQKKGQSQLFTTRYTVC